jgi:hypothetical protein
MTEIRAALNAACPPPRGRERAVLVGASALVAIYADQKSLRDETNPEIDGVSVVITTEFPGWAIRDIDRRGRWHDVEQA